MPGLGYRFDSLQFLDVDRCCTPGIMLAYATMSSPLREETSTHAANQKQNILFMVFRSVVLRDM
jgi:hypothetical protein